MKKAAVCFHDDGLLLQKYIYICPRSYEGEVVLVGDPVAI